MKVKENNFFDFFIFLPTILIMALGLLNLWSIARASEHFSIFIKQLIWNVLAILGMFVVYFLKENFIKKIIIPLYILSIFSLTAVLLWGSYIGGAKRWFKFYLISFQPSELSKLALILILAYLLTNAKTKEFFISLVLTLIPIALIIKEPDLGMSILHLFVWFIMVLFSKIKIIYPLSIVGIGAGSAPIIYSFFLEDYQKARILSFINPEHYAQGAAYNVIMAQNAVGSGGIFGRGFLVSPSVNGMFVPKIETDFVFSAFAEQFGFLGTILIIIAFGIIIFRVLLYQTYYKNAFWKFVSVGISATFMFHIFENIGMNIGITPVTGIPLPFFSYGGSSTFIFGVMIGFLLKAQALSDKLKRRRT
ncbi:rod shape-determining protein RodA [Thermosipho ferrireducens]|uniref:Rod shape-determining protein RodA n=1 Tax=Thermosipho ferrireducens TaxID=2571116 RepID=A0ABX7S723_9BACT|nr:FtsW/RodA/SpoVE family cell cycle protein [Thermosipho ferrireducens]QTA38394.1 rod shape-determining protein RodA [Thermosipho ferrireducens]